MSEPAAPGEFGVHDPGWLRPGLAALAVLLLAGGVHLAVWLEYRDDPFAATHVADALSYHEWGLRIAKQGLGEEPVFHQAPLFPLLLSAVYALTPESARDVSVVWLQIFLNCVAIALLVPLGLRLFGSTVAGVWAALLALGHGPLVFHGLKLLPGPLALATQALALLLLLIARQRGGTARAALAGVSLGLACLARSEMLLFVPAAILALGVGPERAAQPGRRRRAAVVAFLFGVGLALAPAALHNARRGDLALVASSSGENLFIGNQPGAGGGHTPLHPQAGDLFSQRAMASLLAERAEGRTLRPSEVSAHWRRRALRAILDDPVGWLSIELAKVGRILHPGDPTDLYSFALERRLYLPRLWGLPISPWCLLALGATGMALALRRSARRVWPLVALLGAHLAILLAFFVDTRLRLPLLFFMASFGGLALAWAPTAWPSARGRVRVVALGTVTLIGLVAGWASHEPTARDVIRLASVLSMQGRLDESLTVLSPLIDGAAPDPVALDQAGWVLQKQGRLEAAAERYGAALAGELPPPRRPQVLSRLASVLERLGRIGQAAARHDAAVGSDHATAGTYFERAMFRLRHSDAAGAIDDLRQATRLDPRWPPPRRALDALGVEPDANH